MEFIIALLIMVLFFRVLGFLLKAGFKILGFLISLAASLLVFAIPFILIGAIWKLLPEILVIGLITVFTQRRIII